MPNTSSWAAHYAGWASVVLPYHWWCTIATACHGYPYKIPRRYRCVFIVLNWYVLAALYINWLSAESWSSTTSPLSHRSHSGTRTESPCVHLCLLLRGGDMGCVCWFHCMAFSQNSLQDVRYSLCSEAFLVQLHDSVPLSLSTAVCTCSPSPSLRMLTVPVRFVPWWVCAIGFDWSFGCTLHLLYSNGITCATGTSIHACTHVVHTHCTSDLHLNIWEISFSMWYW